MLQVGATVRYGQTGLCRIVEMKEMKIGNETKEYYVLTSLAKNGDFLFVPADNGDLLEKMLPPLTPAEWDEVLSDVKNKEAEWIRDFRRRSEASKKALNSGDRRDALYLIKNIFCHKNDIIGEGKRIHTTDDYFLRDAENLIYFEYSYGMNVSFDEARAKIRAFLDLSE